VKGFVLHPAAYNDLDEIWDYIASDNIDAADRVREELYEAMRSLVSFPHQGHERSDLTARSIRFWPVRDFLIAYGPEEHPLLVLAVLHGRRSPRIIAALLRNRE
jgi:plasmid stabilization system protein ParE